jgi:hypothetical protein
MDDVYIVDSSALIDAMSYYPPDQFPQVWEQLESMTHGGELIVIGRVAEEIGSGNDYLSEGFIKKIAIVNEEETIYLNTMNDIVEGIDPSKKVGWESWLKKADPWIIAVAKTILDSGQKNPMVIHNEVERGNRMRIETECRRLELSDGRLYRIIQKKKIR